MSQEYGIFRLSHKVGDVFNVMNLFMALIGDQVFVCFLGPVSQPTGWELRFSTCIIVPLTC